jgi:hypothetical protein
MLENMMAFLFIWVAYKGFQDGIIRYKQSIYK